MFYNKNIRRIKRERIRRISSSYCSCSQKQPSSSALHEAVPRLAIRVALFVLIVPLVEVDVEHHNSARLQAAEDQPLIGGDGHAAGWTVRLLEREKWMM